MHDIVKKKKACGSFVLYIHMQYYIFSKVHDIHKCSLHKLSIHMNGSFKTFKITDKVN